MMKRYKVTMMNTMIELKAVYDFGENGVRDIYTYTVGYYSSYDYVEKQIDVFCKQEDEYVNGFYGRSYVMFLTDEYVLDTIKEDNNDYSSFVCTRQYKYINGKVVLIHETPKDYKGSDENDAYAYKPGDIIEYLNGNMVGSIGTSVSIIGYAPATVEEMEKHHWVLDDTDDSYLVYDLGEGDTHDHIPSCRIIGLADISPDEEEKYREKLEERYLVNKISEM